MRKVGLFLATLGLVSACKSAATDDVPFVRVDGATPAIVPAVRLSSTLSVSATVRGGARRLLLVDTGSPMTGLDAAAWTGSGISASTTTVPALGIGALTFADVPIVALTECGASCGAFDVTGVLGGNALRSTSVAFDYRTPTVTFGLTSVPAGAVADAVVVPFDVAGGGRGTIAGGDGRVLDVPPTRLVVHATVEGTPRTLVVDTGASYTLLRQSIFSAIVADGRAQLAVTAATANGVAKGSVARAKTIGLGSAVATNSTIGSIADADMDTITSETGQTIDGLLGGAFLRRYYTVIDYGKGDLSLHAYASADPLDDELVRAGVFVSPSGADYVVSQAIAAADVGLVGAVLVDVDGSSLSGKDPETADRLLRGAPGASHTLHLRHGGTTDTRTLVVQDLVP